MDLFNRKKEQKEEKERVRAPVQKMDREEYVRTMAKPKKETKSKGDKKDMAVKKTTAKADAKKTTVKKTATEKKEAAPKAAAKKETKAATEKKTAAKPAAQKKEAAPKEKPKVWHITKREDVDKWQVKAEGNEKATKLFRTKAEAQDYVKKMSANNEGSRVVSHKKDGKFQKK